jgi:hypothetical protein
MRGNGGRLPAQPRAPSSGEAAKQGGGGFGLGGVARLFGWGGALLGLGGGATKLAVDTGTLANNYASLCYSPIDNELTVERIQQRPFEGLPVDQWGSSHNIRSSLRNLSWGAVNATVGFFIGGGKDDFIMHMAETTSKMRYQFQKLHPGVKVDDFCKFRAETLGKGFEEYKKSEGTTGTSPGLYTTYEQYRAKLKTDFPADKPAGSSKTCKTGLDGKCVKPAIP